MRYLTEDDIERLHIEIIDTTGGSNGIRDRGRIKSAVSAQKQVFFGKELYKTIFDKAAVLTRGIITDHPFIDGNKRTGILSGIMLMELNGYDMSRLRDRELEEFAVYVAVHKPDIPTIAAWFKRYSKPKH